MYKKANREWETLDKDTKMDYTLRRIGENEVHSYIKSKATNKNKDSEFVPKSPYAMYINEKVKKYSKDGKIRIRMDHKLLYIIFKMWCMMTQDQKNQYIYQFDDVI